MSDIVVSNLPVLVDIASVGIQGAQGLQGVQGPVGPVGPQGPQGLPGAAVGIGEAPTDGTIYGRQGNSATWHNVLGLATGGTVSAATTFSSTLAASGGGSVAGTFSGTPTWSGAHTFSAAGTALSVTNAATVTGQLNIGSTISIGTTVAGGGNTTISTPNGSHININPQGSAHVKIGGGTGPIDFGPALQTSVIAAANLAAGAGTAYQQNMSISGIKNFAAITGINQWNVSSDVGALTGQPVFHTAVNYNFGGGAYTGNRGGVIVNMQQTGATSGTSNAGGIVGMQSGAAVTNTFGGTNSSPSGAAGSIFAANFTTSLSAAAANIRSTCGLEIDIAAAVGATYLGSVGLLVASTTAHQQPATGTNNVAITVGGQTNTVGLDIAYGITSWALNANGALFQADFAGDKATFAVGRGFDLRAITFANDIFAASGFAVGPTGRVRVGTGYFDVTSTGAALSVDGAVCTGGTLTGAVATTYASDGNAYFASDAYGGMWQVTFVNATSSITAITMVLPPAVKGATPTNPITLTPIARLHAFVPATMTANLTWNTTRTVLALQPTTGGTITMPALLASTTYANDAAAATGGVPLGGVYRNGSNVSIRVV